MPLRVAGVPWPCKKSPAESDGPKCTQWPRDLWQASQDTLYDFSSSAVIFQK